MSDRNRERLKRMQQQRAQQQCAQSLQAQMAGQVRSPTGGGGDQRVLSQAEQQERLRGQGVLQVTVRRATNLVGKDRGGTSSDPYVVLSVGGGDDGYGYGRPKSSARTSTKKNTLNPRWGDDDDGRCVMCARRDPRAQTLTLDVYDEDRLPGKKDDFLGTATVCFADLVEDAIASTLPGFQSRRRECLGVALQGGPGGGAVDFSLTFTPLSAPAREVRT